MRQRHEHRAIAIVITVLLLAHAALFSPITVRGVGHSLNKSVSVGVTAPPVDWSREVIESTIKRYPTAESLKGWGYAKSLYLYGQYLVYLRTKDRRYLEHIKAWVDLHIDEKGIINLPLKISNHDGWATLELTSQRTAEVSWQVFFEPAGGYRFPVREPQNLWAERAGLDGVNLRWNVQPQPAVGYQVTLNGRVMGFTPSQVFSLRGLDPEASYTVEVRTAWQDGTLSEKRAQLKFTLKELLPTEISLSELDPLRMTSGWRQPEVNRTFTRKGLSVGGRSFASGIGMPTNSEIEFELSGTYDSFQSLVGIDDEFNNEGSVKFAVLGDGKELWSSGALKKTDGAKPVHVVIKNVRRLLLRVTREGEGGRIPADWLDAKLTR
jgi:hypothetical protein